jgi:hypothetical protein
VRMFTCAATAVGVRQPLSIERGARRGGNRCLVKESAALDPPRAAAPAAHDRRKAA